MPPAANESQEDSSCMLQESVLGQAPPAAAFSSSASSASSSTAATSRASESCFRGLPDLLQVGGNVLHIASQVREMVDSGPLFRSGQVAAWKRRLDQDGYLLLRAAVPPAKILAARQCVCEAISKDWEKIDLAPAEALRSASTASAIAAVEATGLPSAPVHRSSVCTPTDFAATPLLRARISRDSTSGRLNPGLLLTGFRGVTHDPRVLSVLEGEELVDIFSQLFGRIREDEREQHNGAIPSIVSSPSSAAASFSTSVSSLSSATSPPLAAPSTFETKWCRVHGHGEFTDEHSDYYRFEHWDKNSSGTAEENGARHMYTCWVPLGDYPVTSGTLVVAEGTHLLSGYCAGVYGDSSRELPPDFESWRNGTGGCSSPGVWRTAHFEPGDVVVFDLRLVHASTPNLTPHYRISCDTRWKPTEHLLGQRDAFKNLTPPTRS